MFCWYSVVGISGSIQKSTWGNWWLKCNVVSNFSWKDFANACNDFFRIFCRRVGISPFSLTTALWFKISLGSRGSRLEHFTSSPANIGTFTDNGPCSKRASDILCRFNTPQSFGLYPNGCFCSAQWQWCFSMATDGGWSISQWYNQS